MASYRGAPPDTANIFRDSTLDGHKQLILRIALPNAPDSKIGVTNEQSPSSKIGDTLDTGRISTNRPYINISYIYTLFIYCTNTNEPSHVPIEFKYNVPCIPSSQPPINHTDHVPIDGFFLAFFEPMHKSYLRSPDNLIMHGGGE